MSLNRVVALFTPVFAAVAGLGSAYAAKHGLNLLAEQITVVEVAASTAALAAAIKWLHGSQLAEKYVHEAEEAVANAARYAKDAGITLPSESELVKATEAEIASLTSQLTGQTEKLRASRENTNVQARRAEAAEANLHLVRQAVSHVRADANLVEPVVADSQPVAVVQPEDEVAADVASAAPAVVAQAPVAADVAALTPIAQAT